MKALTYQSKDIANVKVFADKETRKINGQAKNYGIQMYASEAHDNTCIRLELQIRESDGISTLCVLP